MMIFVDDPIMLAVLFAICSSFLDLLSIAVLGAVGLGRYTWDRNEQKIIQEQNPTTFGPNPN